METTPAKTPVRPALCRRAAAAMVTAGAVMLVATGTHAETWPAKPVTLIVPYAAGGTVDKVARQIQDGLRKRLAQPVMIDNRAGAGGTIGTAQIARSTADGYTIGMVFDAFATESYIYPKLPYSSQKDLTGVSYMVRSPMVLVVPASSQYKTLQDYVAAAKKPDTVSYASVGAGSSNQLVAELFHEAAGTSGTHTPYKGGGPAINDLLGGHVDSMIASLPLVMPYIAAGKLRALAVTARQRDARLSGVPAVAEVYKGFEAYSWVAMIAPSRTPPNVVGKLAAEVNATLRDPAIAKVLREGGFEIIAGDGAQANKLIQEESVRWGRLIKARHIATE
ncbi:tripartite tricarboxylate transporter substrate binding protein (plasmid) [Cupriavidus sp. P-10]|uniref:tripartite tricarboxylate transporter substrate binding protein n=1 Tax=Cupriavidus sp. P-10 TaxID=2027911 RepID=UPI000E2EC188|nr:tripartite tricarboxylate transporter substrate binding protein [Cupriavidus sp. P-10]BDB29936.1 tripartite tricarboxylate transporter substrate binding protein [Cupriavidus sp. P-10]